jgi:hypothetical protein
MALGILAMHILEVMFFVGMAGSAVVVLTTLVGIIIHSIWKTESEA